MTQDERVTVAWVRSQVERIDAAKGDPEIAHSLRDALWRTVLVSIARPNHDAQEMTLVAAEALRVDELDLTLWFA